MYLYFPHIADGELRQKWTKHHTLSGCQPSGPRIDIGVREPERGAVLQSGAGGMLWLSNTHVASACVDLELLLSPSPHWWHPTRLTLGVPRLDKGFPVTCGCKTPLIPSIAQSWLSVRQTQAAGCAWSALEDEGGRGNKPIPSPLRASPCLPSLFPGLSYLLSFIPYRSVASPAYLSPLSSWQGRRRVGLAAAAPAAGMFGEGCCRPGGETRRRRWLPRQGKRDAETDGCVHREHCLGGERRVGGCTDRAASPPPQKKAVQAGLLLWALTQW